MAALKAVARARNGAAEVFLDGPVGFPKEGGMNAAALREQLARANGAPVNLFINSVGGKVTEGMAMYNSLRAYKGRKVGIVTGIAASIASVVLMACDEIRVAKGAYVMIHNPSSEAAGGAEDLRAAAETLESMRSELLDIYEARTGIDRKKLEKMLDAETYLTAEEAVECGMADKLESFEAKIELCAVARLDPKKVPAELRAAAKGKEKAMKPKMKAAIEAKEAELAALKARAEEDGDAEPEDTEDEPHDSEDDDEPEDSEDDDDGDKKESEKAILETVYAMTGTKKAATALGKLAGIVAKGARSAATGRADQIKAAVKAGLLLPAVAKVAEGWSDKAWNTYLSSIGGTKALKLGKVHSQPKEQPAITPVASGKEGDAEKITRLMGVKLDDVRNKAPDCAPQLKGGAN